MSAAAPGIAAPTAKQAAHAKVARRLPKRLMPNARTMRMSPRPAGRPDTGNPPEPRPASADGRPAPCTSRRRRRCRSRIPRRSARRQCGVSMCSVQATRVKPSVRRCVILPRRRMSFNHASVSPMRQSARLRAGGPAVLGEIGLGEMRGLVVERRRQFVHDIFIHSRSAWPQPQSMLMITPSTSIWRKEHADDRPLLLDHAERPQDHDLPRGDRTALQDHSDQHRQGRAVQGRVSRHLPEQPHPGAGRSRSARRRRADLGVRVRRHAGLSRREDRQVSADRSAQARRRHAVAVLADGRARPDVRAEQSFQQLRGRTRSSMRWTATATR